MTIEAHKEVLETGYSWVTTDSSQACVGFLTAKVVDDDFYIGEVSVHEAHQKKGLGSKLFEAAFIKAKSLGLHAVTLTTFKDVPWNAPYYERLGFLILEPQSVPPYLETTLRNEAADGMPMESRCAMKKTPS